MKALLLFVSLITLAHSAMGASSVDLILALNEGTGSPRQIMSREAGDRMYVAYTEGELGHRTLHVISRQGDGPWKPEFSAETEMYTPAVLDVIAGPDGALGVLVSDGNNFHVKYFERTDAMAPWQLAYKIGGVPYEGHVSARLARAPSGDLFLAVNFTHFEVSGHMELHRRHLGQWTKIDLDNPHFFFLRDFNFDRQGRLYMTGPTEVVQEKPFYPSEVYRSDDLGRSWKLLDRWANSLQGATTSSRLLHGQNGLHILLVSSDPKYFWNFEQAFIRVSRDDGATWQNVFTHRFAEMNTGNTMGCLVQDSRGRVRFAVSSHKGTDAPKLEGYVLEGDHEILVSETTLSPQTEAQLTDCALDSNDRLVMSGAVYSFETKKFRAIIARENSAP